MIWSKGTGNKCVMKKYVLGVALLWAFAGPAGAEQPIKEGAPEMNLEKATFAAGCFWCTQSTFDKIKGVRSTRAGYTGGHVKDPTYEQVCSGTTGHAEAIEVIYDSGEVTYQKLLDAFWRAINPTQKNQQFFDKGEQYRTVIFYHNDEQKRLAEASRQALADSGKFSKPIVTEIAPVTEFYPAEDYHQQYYKKSPMRYQMYNAASGRAEYRKEVWGEGK